MSALIYFVVMLDLHQDKLGSKSAASSALKLPREKIGDCNYCGSTLGQAERLAQRSAGSSDFANCVLRQPTQSCDAGRDA